MKDIDTSNDCHGVCIRFSWWGIARHVDLWTFSNTFTIQGVVTSISTVLRAATGDCDPVYGGCRRGLPYYSVYYQKVMQSWLFFATVTGSPAV